MSGWLVTRLIGFAYKWFYAGNFAKFKWWMRKLSVTGGSSQIDGNICIFEVGMKRGLGLFISLGSFMMIMTIIVSISMTLRKGKI